MKPHRWPGSTGLNILQTTCQLQMGIDEGRPIIVGSVATGVKHLETILGIDAGSVDMVR